MTAIIVFFLSYIGIGKIPGFVIDRVGVEQASHFHIRISFRQHAAVGIPVTLLSLVILVGWITAVG